MSLICSWNAAFAGAAFPAGDGCEFPGPNTLVGLSKPSGDEPFDKSAAIQALVPSYIKLLNELNALGVPEVLVYPLASLGNNLETFGGIAGLLLGADPLNLVPEGLWQLSLPLWKKRVGRHLLCLLELIWRNLCHVPCCCPFLFAEEGIVYSARLRSWDSLQ